MSGMICYYKSVFGVITSYNKFVFGYHAYNENKNRCDSRPFSEVKTSASHRRHVASEKLMASLTEAGAPAGTRTAL